MAATGLNASPGPEYTQVLGMYGFNQPVCQIILFFFVCGKNSGIPIKVSLSTLIHLIQFSCNSCKILESNSTLLRYIK